MSEIGFTGDMRGGDPRIEAIMFSLLFISNGREESFQIREFLQPLEHLKKKEAHRIVGMASPGGVSGGADGSDEREIDQGGDKPGESTCDLSGGIDLDPSGDIAVIGKEPAS